MRRVLVTVALATIAALLLPNQPAGAASVSSGASAFASAGYTGTAQMQANLTLTGSLGGLLNGLITPIVNNALNPLVAALQGTASNIVGAALGPASSYAATTPTDQGGTAPAAFPTDLPGGLPSPCSTSSATQPCYSATSVAPVSVPVLATVDVGAARGYTQQTPSSADATNPIFGRAQTTGTDISVLAGTSSIVNPAVSVGTVDALANCPNSGSTTPSASVSAANVSVLGGVVTLGVANGAITTITANGTTYPTLDDLPDLTFGGITLQPYGDSIAVTLPLTVSQLAAALGLSSSITSTLLTYATSGTELSLTFVIGPNTEVTKTTALAWGLGIGVDLSGSLTFDLLGIVGARISVPTGISGSNFGNVLDLRLGYTSCRTGSATDGGNKMIPLQYV
jgi:hypothetical protein